MSTVGFMESGTTSAWQVDAEDGTRWNVLAGVDGPAVLGDDPPDDRETKPAAAALGRVVRQEQLLPVLWRNARTVVAHRDPDDAVDRIVLGRDLDGRQRSVGTRTRRRTTQRLHGVVDEIDDHAPDLLCIDPH